MQFSRHGRDKFIVGAAIKGAGLLTGMYQQRFGHECNLDSDVNNSFDPNQITIAEALKKRKA